MALHQQYLFGRSYRLQVQAKDGGAAAVYGNQAQGQSPLRVNFEIERDSIPTPNGAKITVFNLSAASRAALGPGYIVSLAAGYDGLVDRIFLGAVQKVTITRQNADIATQMELSDGAGALLGTLFKKDYPPKTTHLATVLSDVAAAMKIDAGIVVGLPDETFGRGLSLHGSCQDILRTLLNKHGLEFTVQNGKLNIMPYHTHLGSAAVVLSESTGLLGVPSAPEKDAVQFEALLNPRLVPGQLVQVVGAQSNIDGFYKLRKVKFTGDTHDQDWKASCEAARVTQPLQTLTPAFGLAYGQAVVAGLI